MAEKKTIPFNKPFIVGKELHYISQAVVSNSHLSGDGPFTRRCHQWMENRLGCCKALLTHSGSTALEMAGLLCGVQPGDEVIMPSFTFVSTANAFVLRGAVPVFVDIRPDTLNIDERLIEKAISPKTKAIVPVHYAGVSCAMDEIMAIARQYGLSVIEDAAHGFLACYKDHNLGTIGHLGCLSFHETKNVISGEGGALLINDSELIERAEIIWEKGTDRSKFLRGQVDKYTWVDVGSSYLPGELTAAFLWAQFENAEEINAKRSRLWRIYYERLKPFEEQGWFRLPTPNDHCISTGHLFHILTNSLEERIRLTHFLNQNGVNAVFHYVPLHSSPGGRKYGRQVNRLDVTDKVGETLLRLPIYFEMTEEEVIRVVETIKTFFDEEFNIKSTVVA